MAVAIKVNLLVIVLVTVFLPLDGVDVDGFRCFHCDTFSSTSRCESPGSRTFKVPCMGNGKCVKNISKTGNGAIGRECSHSKMIENIQAGQCFTTQAAETCVCDTDLCNSAGYLHGAPFLVFGVILLAVVVSNLERQHLN